MTAEPIAAVPWKVVDRDPRRVVVCARKHGGAVLEPISLTQEEAWVLARCQSLVPLDEHVRRLREGARAGGGSVTFGGPVWLPGLTALSTGARASQHEVGRMCQRAAATIGSLAEKGLFMRQREIEACLRQVRSGLELPEATSLVVRPGWCRVGRDHATSTVRIEDGSGQVGRDEEGRAEWRIRVSARERLVRILAEQRFEPRIVEFALGAPEAQPAGGAWRNLILLLTAGQKVVFFEGDVAADASLVAPEGQRKMMLYGSGDPRRCRRAPPRPDAETVPARAAQELSTSLSRMLGRTAHGVLADEGRVALEPGLSADALDRVMLYGGGLRIAAAIPGRAGHRDEAWQAWLPRLHRCRHSLEAREQGCMCSGESDSPLVLGVESPAVSLGGFFADRCFGYDNRCEGIPFVPEIAREDGPFGTMLHLGMPDACVGYVPVIARAEQDARVVRDGRQVGEVVHLGASELLSSLVRKLQPDWRIDNVGAWSSYMGSALEGVASSAAPEFLEMAYECAHVEWMSAHRMIEELLDSDEPLAGSLRRALLQLRRRLELALRRPRDVIPRDSRGLRECIGNFGRLVTVWPSMWKACAALTMAERAERFFGEP